MSFTFFINFVRLCDDLGLDLSILIERLREIGYIYDLETRQFKLVSN